MKTTKQATLSDALFQGCTVAKPSPSHMSQHINKKRAHPFKTSFWHTYGRLYKKALLQFKRKLAFYPPGLGDLAAVVLVHDELSGLSRGVNNERVAVEPL